MKTKPTVRIEIPTPLEYWGTEATEENVEIAMDKLESLISGEFSDRALIEFERTQTPHNTGVHSENEDIAEEIHAWISENWTAAL